MNGNLIELGKVEGQTYETGNSVTMLVEGKRISGVLTSQVRNPKEKPIEFILKVDASESHVLAGAQLFGHHADDLTVMFASLSASLLCATERRIREHLAEQGATTKRLFSRSQT